MRTHFFMDNTEHVRRQVQITVFDMDNEIIEVTNFDFTEDNLVIETVEGKLVFSSICSYKDRFKVELFMTEGSGEVVIKHKVIKGTKWFDVNFEPNYSWKKEAAA